MFSLKRSWAVCLLLGVSVWMSCFDTATNYSFVVPAGSAEMRERQVVVLAGFDSDDASIIRTNLIGEGSHEVVDELAAQEATVILIGDISAEYGAERQKELKEEPRKCIERGKKQKGQKGRPCVKWRQARTYTNHSLTERCQITLRVKLSRVIDGALLDERRFVAHHEENQTTRDNLPGPVGESVVCSEARRSVFNDLNSWLSPHRVAARIEFGHASSEGMRAPTRRLQAGDLEGALAALEANIVNMSVDDVERAWLRYNYAMLLEITGNWALCVEQAELAADVLDEERVLNLAARCRHASN